MPILRPSFASRILLKFVGNILLIYGLFLYIPTVFIIQNTVINMAVIAFVITVLNQFIRPILQILTLPLSLFASILSILIVNGIILQGTVMILQSLQLQSVTLAIGGGLFGWLVLTFIFGLGNWLLQLLFS